MMLLEPEWIERLLSYKTIHVGYSGGLDSTVLLHQLAHIDQLKNNISAVHVHHGLSANADEWQTHCELYCQKLSIPLTVSRVKFDSSANIEERARVARYAVFAECLDDHDCLVLAHHRDDQAETLLLHLVRGTGVDGLAAMPVSRTLAKGHVLRPFLHLTREDLASYARTHQLPWIDDESNLNIDYSRNYIRQRILPLLRVKWPNVVNNLAMCADHCQEAKLNLHVLASLDCDELTDTQLSMDALPLHEHSRLKNVLRVWLKQHGIQRPSTRMLTSVMNDVILAAPDRVPSVTWDNVTIRRYQRVLYLETQCLNEIAHSKQCVIDRSEFNDRRDLNRQQAMTDKIWANFPSAMMLDDQICLQAIQSTVGLWIPAGSQVEVRYRQGGELFRWHGQTKELKKLFQQWQVPPWQRHRVPLIYVNHRLQAVVGYAIADQGDALVDDQPRYVFSCTTRELLCHSR